jgi:myo-inositol-1(or 4)-monophosphatase
LLEIALAAARAGARVLLNNGLGRYQSAERKRVAGDYVTAVDHASEEAVLEVLTKETPGIPVLAEERGGVRNETMWVVDPLDGTTNYMRGCPIVAVAVAMLRDGIPEIGAVVAPWLHLEFGAERHQGAWLNSEQLPPLGTCTPDQAVVTTCFPYRERARLGQYELVLGGALRRFEDLRRGGAACLDLAWTAAGNFDGLFALQLGTWDIAAGAALVLEVGGIVTDWSGGNEWLQSGDILAGPPAVHEALLELASGMVGKPR